MKPINKNPTYWKDIVFQASGNSTAQLIGILGLPILTRLYTPEDFSDQAFFIQLTTLFVAFVTFRFEYFVPILKNYEESALLTKWIVKVGLIMVFIYTILLAVFHICVEAKIINYGFSIYWYLVPITAYLLSLSVLYQHEAQRVGNYKISGFSEVASKLSYVLSGVFGSFLNTSLSLLFTTGFGALGKTISLRKYILRVNTKTHLDINSIVQSFRNRAIGMVFANTLLTCSGLIPLYFIINMYGPVTVGHFSLVMATLFLPSGVVGAAIGNVFYQRAGVLWNERDFESLLALWYRTIKKLFYMALPIYVFAFFVMPTVYPFIFGTAWQEAGNYAQIMTLAAFFSFIAGPLDRLSLVLGVGYYLPAIHFFRLILIFSFSIICYVFKVDVAYYILGFSILMSLVYISDVILGRFFLYIKS